MSAPAWRPVVASDLPYLCSDPDCDRAAIYLTHVFIPSEGETGAITSCGDHITQMAFAASAIKEQAL